MDKYYYKATTAFRQYKTVLVEARTGINISEADLKVPSGTISLHYTEQPSGDRALREDSL